MDIRLGFGAESLEVFALEPPARPGASTKTSSTSSSSMTVAIFEPVVSRSWIAFNLVRIVVSLGFLWMKVWSLLLLSLSPTVNGSSMESSGVVGAEV